MIQGADKWSRLRPSSVRQDHQGERYSLFIHRMKIILPLGALAIITVLMSWNIVQKQTVLPQKEAKTEDGTPSIGKNELLNPHFDSVDEQGQPYTITAARAVQGGAGGVEDPVLLEKPAATLTLKNGPKLSLSSEQGDFLQKDQHLFLKNDVTLTYSTGAPEPDYTVKTQGLNIDLQAHSMETDLDVRGEGKGGTLEAKGLKGDEIKGTLIFKGPAKLVIFEQDKKFDLKGASP